MAGRRRDFEKANRERRVFMNGAEPVDSQLDRVGRPIARTNRSDPAEPPTSERDKAAGANWRANLAREQKAKAERREKAKARRKAKATVGEKAPTKPRKRVPLDDPFADQEKAAPNPSKTPVAIKPESSSAEGRARAEAEFSRLTGGRFDDPLRRMNRILAGPRKDAFLNDLTALVWKYEI